MGVSRTTSSVFKGVGVVTGGVNSFSSASYVLITLKHDAVLAPAKGPSDSQELMISGFNAYKIPTAIRTSSPCPNSISSMMWSSLNWLGSVLPTVRHGLREVERNLTTPGYFGGMYYNRYTPASRSTSISMVQSEATLIDEPPRQVRSVLSRIIAKQLSPLHPRLWW
jgi:hypothetical protein